MNAAVWITRPASSSSRLSARLRSEGYVSVEAPVLEIQFQSAELPQPADWLVFVSANAVKGYARVCREQGLTPGEGPERVAVVGRRTAEAARHAGWNTDLVPFVERAEGLLNAFAPFDLTRCHVIVPGGNRPGSATTLIPERLSRAGARVTAVEVYRTLDRLPDPTERAELARWKPGAVLLYSPSAVDAWRGSLTESDLAPWATATVVAVGPVTADRARHTGLDRVLVCEQPTDTAVLDQLRTVDTLQTSRNLP